MRSWVYAGTAPAYPLILCLLQPPDQLQLWKDQVVLEDAKKLADLKVENDDVVVMCYQNAGANATGRTRCGLCVLCS
jgi:hypothetical protein